MSEPYVTPLVRRREGGGLELSFVLHLILSHFISFHKFLWPILVRCSPTKPRRSQNVLVTRWFRLVGGGGAAPDRKDLGGWISEVS